MSRFLTIGLFSVAGLALSSTSAMALTQSAQFNSVGPKQDVTITLNAGANTQNVAAGLMNWTSTGGGIKGGAEQFKTFCIEVDQNIGGGNIVTFNVVAPELAPNTAPAGVIKAALLSELYGRFFAGLVSGNNQQHAAFQLAVWEIVYDNGVSLSADSFQVTSAPTGTAALAQSWLDALNGTGPMIVLSALTHPTRQDQLVPFSVIPTPGAMAALGLGGLVATRRRR